MSKQPPNDPKQNLNISDNASLDNVQIGGVAGRDLNVNQIRGKVVNVTIYDRIDGSDGLGQKEVSITQSLTQKEYRHRQVLLNKVREYWIEGRLNRLLHTKIPINLSLEKRLDEVQHPFSKAEEFSDSSSIFLPKETEIEDIFNQMGDGRTLLILGEPGSGKTITLLKLAQSLISRTEKDIRFSLPVVFNLSSWGNKQLTIADWLVEELKSKYSIPKTIGKKWIKEQQLLLLLDGLDEVKTELREYCIQALNQFLQAHGITEVVVCSRVREYKILLTRLNLLGAVCIQPLTFEQINDFINKAEGKNYGLKTVLQIDLESDRVDENSLYRLAETPLFLSIMLTAYEGISASDIHSLPKDDLRKHLFDRYINRMFYHRQTSSKKYKKRETSYWLKWLAQQMNRSSQQIFLIEELQVNCLVTRVDRVLYKLISIIIAWFSSALMMHMFFTASILIMSIIVIPFRAQNTQDELNILNLILYISLKPILLFLYGLYGTISALIVGFSSRTIKTVETLKWSKETACKEFKKAFKILFFVCQIYGWSHTYDLYLQYKFSIPFGIGRAFRNGIFSGVLNGMILGSIIAMILGFKGYPLEKKSKPNQGIWNSVLNAFRITMIGGFVIGSIMLFLFWIGVITGQYQYKEDYDKLYLIISPFAFLWLGTWLSIPFFFFLGGGKDLVKHFTLRLILFIRGYIPWNFSRFLDYATDHIFLQKVGGSYIFIHRMLMEHFAEKDLEIKKH